MQFLKKLGLSALILLFSACSRVPTLGLTNHVYGRKPKNIVIFQVPGLSHSQVAMIRFSLKDARQKSSFGKMACTGNMWAFNFYEIRPSMRDSLLAQLTGRKEIKSACSDYDSKPFWEYLESDSKLNVVMESSAPGDASLLENLKCEEKKFLENVAFYSMTSGEKSNGNQTFHFQEPMSFENGVYHDKTCDGRRCFATFPENVKSLFKNLEKEKSKEKFIVLRNFEYHKHLSNMNIVKAKEALFDVNAILAFLMEWEKKNDDTLILLTSASPIRLEFPARGAQWRQFERNGDFVQFRKSDLWAPIYAHGAGAEKFCGVMEESSLIDRYLHKSSERRFSLDIFNSL